jgi:hypothetical protein
MENKKRSVLIWNKENCGYGVESDFEEIKKGDVFRLFEPCGEPVGYKDSYDFLALGDAYYHNDIKEFTIHMRVASQEDFK